MSVDFGVGIPGGGVVDQLSDPDLLADVPESTATPEQTQAAITARPPRAVGRAVGNLSDALLAGFQPVRDRPEDSAKVSAYLSAVTGDPMLYDDPDIIASVLRVDDEYPELGLVANMDWELSQVLALTNEEIQTKIEQQGLFDPEVTDLIWAVSETILADKSNMAYWSRLQAADPQASGNFAEFARGEKAEQFSADLETDGDLARTFRTHDRGESTEWVATTNSITVVNTFDGGEAQTVVRLDPGTKIEDGFDMLYELARAEAGAAHTVVSQDDVPTRRGIGGQIAKAIGDFSRWGRDNSIGRGVLTTLIDASSVAAPAAGNLARQVWGDSLDTGSPEARRALHDEASAKADADFAFDPHMRSEAFYAGEAIQRYAEDRRQNEMDTSFNDAYDVYAAGDLSAIVDDVRNETFQQDYDELVRYYTDAAEAEDTVQAKFNRNIIGPILTGAEWWDDFTHGLVLRVLDVADDARRGDWQETLDILSAPNTSLDGEIENPDRVSEWMGVGGGYGQTLDLAVSVVADPFNLMFLGGKGNVKLLQRALTSQEGSDIIMRARPIRQGIKSLVDATPQNANIRLAAFDGIEPIYDDLLKIANTATDDLSRAARVELHQEAEKLLRSQLPAFGGEWIPNSLQTLANRHAVKVTTPLIRKFDTIGLDDQNAFMKALHNMAQERHTSMDTFFDDYRGLVLTFIDDPKVADDFIREALDAVALSRTNRDVYRGIFQRMTEKATTERDRLVRFASRHGDVPLDRAQSVLDDINVALRELDGTASEGYLELVEAATRQARYIDNLKSVETNVAKARADVAEAVSRAENAIRNAQAKRDTSTLHDTLWKLYEKIGNDLGLERVDGGIRYPSGNRMHRWSQVHTFDAHKFTKETTRRSAGWIDEIDTELARRMEAFGLNSNAQAIPMPASMWDIAVYKAAVGREGTMRALSNATRRTMASTPLQYIRNFWASAVLISPLPALRSGTDEVFRFLSETGNLADSVRSLPGFGFLSRQAPSRSASIHMAHAGGLGMSRSAPWAVLSRPSGRFGRRAANVDFDVAARRFADQLTGDEWLQAYAVNLGDAVDGNVPQKFIDWWEGAGVESARASGIRLNLDGNIRMVATDAQEAWNTAEHFFDAMGNVFARKGKGADLQQSILDATVAKTKVGDDVVKLFDRTMGQEGPTGFNHLWSALYGSPQQRRGAIFFDNFYDQIEGTLREAYGSKMLTRERLSEMASFTDDQLDSIAGHGSRSLVGSHLREFGFKTEGDLNRIAARWAGRRTDNLMFHMIASTTLGKTMDRALITPFVRAQMDFMGYWVRRLFEPPQMRAGLRRVLPEAFVSGRMGVEQLPVNLRLWGRYLHMIDAFSDEDTTLPEQAFNRVMFLPLQFDENVLADVIPGIGPLPAPMVEALVGVADSEGLDQWLTLLQPNRRFYDGFASSMVPSTDTSLIGMGANLAKLLPLGDSEWKQSVLRALTTDATPPGLSDAQSVLGGDWLRENWQSMNPDSDSWSAEMERMNDQAWNETHRTDATSGLLTAATLKFARNDYQRQGLLNLASITDNLDWMLERGIITTLDFEEIPEWWAAVQSGEADRETYNTLWNKLNTIWFDRLTEYDDANPEARSVRDWMILQDPALAIVATSKLECSGLGPAEWQALHCEADDTTVFRGSEETKIEDRTEALDRGWVRNRPMDVWMEDAAMTVRGAAGRVLKHHYQAATGASWRSVNQYGQVSNDLGPVPFSRPLVEPALEAVGLTLPGDVVTTQQLRDYLDREWFEKNPIRDRSYTAFMATTFAESMQRFPAGQAAMDTLETAADFAADQGYDGQNISNWSPDLKERVRVAIADALGEVTAPKDALVAYVRDAEGYFGPLDWEVPELPLLADNTSGPESPIVIEPGDWIDGKVWVSDGDGVAFRTSDDQVFIIRLMGINAADEFDVGYEEAGAKLERFMREHTITFKLHDVENFTWRQTVAPEVERFKLWMYADGIPVYDPDQFTATNTQGAQFGGTVPNYDELWRNQADRLGVEVPEKAAT